MKLFKKSKERNKTNSKTAYALATLKVFVKELSIVRNEIAFLGANNKVRPTIVENLLKDTDKLQEGINKFIFNIGEIAEDKITKYTGQYSYEVKRLQYSVISLSA